MMVLGSLLLLIGLACLLYGGIYFRSGRADTEQDSTSVVLENLRFSGRLFLWIGGALTAVGLISLTIGVLIEVLL